MKRLTIDCDYLEPKFAAAYLLEDQGEAAFIDNNTAHSVPRLLEALRAEGLTPEQVKYVIITHVHLDHAGGTGALMQACPKATLLAHPRAVRHMVDPSKLEKSARQVYGDAEFEKLYGAITPIAASRVREMADGASVSLGSRTLTFLHTRGHANHHFCILDSGPGAESAIYTGDAFGLRYPALQAAGLFIFPSTSPTDFDPPEAFKALDRIVESGAKVAYLTHYDGVRELEAARAQLREHLEFAADLLERTRKSAMGPEELSKFCRAEWTENMRRALRRRGLSESDATWKLLKLDLELNGDGVAWAARRLRGEFERK